MAEGRTIQAMLALTLVLLLAVAVVLTQGEPRSAGSQVTVVTTFPGLKPDILSIAGECNVTVLELVAGDPHTAQLSPSQARLLAEADIIVTMGHTPADMKAEELASGIVIDIPSIEGVKLLNIPGDGVNLHYPIYDPENYLAFLDALARAMEDAGCTPDYNSTTARAARSLIDNYKGAANGMVGVADQPFIQYAVAWLGVDVRIILRQGEHSQASGMMLDEAARLLDEGAVAFIAVDENGEPITSEGEWLLREAQDRGAPLVRVPAPYLERTTPELLEYVIEGLEPLLGRG